MATQSCRWVHGKKEFWCSHTPTSGTVMVLSCRSGLPGKVSCHTGEKPELFESTAFTLSIRADSKESTRGRLHVFPDPPQDTQPRTAIPSSELGSGCLALGNMLLGAWMNIPTWVAFTSSLGGLDPGLLFIITFRDPNVLQNPNFGERQQRGHVGGRRENRGFWEPRREASS